MEYLFVYILMCIQLLSSSVVSFLFIKFSSFFYRFSLPVLFYIVCLDYPLFPICISERNICICISELLHLSHNLM